MARAAWRQHVREALESREGSTRRLCRLLEQHEKLQHRLETLLSGAGAEGRYQVEVVELRREREERHQQLAAVTESLERAEAESRQQRGRLQHIARDLRALQHQHRELQCEAWGLSQEAKGLRVELDQAQRFLHKAQQERLELEDRWVREKVLEAERLNRANEREEKHRWKVGRLLAKLERAGAAAAHTPKKAPRMVDNQASCNASWEEAEKAAAVEQVKAAPTISSPPVGWDRSHLSSAGLEV